MTDVGTEIVEQCIWSTLFEEEEKISLEEGYFITGILIVALGIWLNLSILLTNLRKDISYRLLVNFTLTACVRKALALLPFARFIGRSGEWQLYCNLFVFLETFLAVFEIEWLTHICIERYVFTKYVTNGWPINKRHYALFTYLCIFFASLYSFLPIFGIGNYGFDLSCTRCTFDMILPDSWKMYFVVAIFFLRTIKPVIVMVMMLTWAIMIEDKIDLTEKNLGRRTYTWNVFMITLTNVVCGLPLALIRGTILFSQLVHTQIIIIASGEGIKMSLWLHWVAPGLTVLVLFFQDKNIRNKMIMNKNNCSMTNEIRTDVQEDQKEK